MNGKLTIVATPIGNLRDITLRALDALADADLILAEDTRHSQNLLVALNIKLKPHCRLISSHSQVEKKRIDVLAEHLAKGERVVMVSDAGCPTVSDPGSWLVMAAVDLGATVEVIPGASAVMAALMGAGLDTTRFAFLGFLPKKPSVRQKLVQDAARGGLAVVIFESPLRVEELLAQLHTFLGPARVVVARELTKMYETFHRGRLGQPLAPPFMPKGECVVVVETSDVASNAMSEEDQKLAITEFIAANLGQYKTKELAQLVAEKFGVHKGDAYETVLAIKGALGG
jgi:16S rRNA (cytidine1402-2'-O)-methyltransferase